MRLFRDDPTRITPVTWFFTDPAAKWCGMANVFNSRNWYGGVKGWPDLGEVEGAPRPWYSGKTVCHSGFDTLGTEDQWEHGADLADAISVDPCDGPLVQAFGEVQVVFEEGAVAIFGTRFSPDLWYAASGFVPGNFYVLRANSNGPGCCFARQADFRICFTGPPTFDEYPPDLQGKIIDNPLYTGCARVSYSPDGLGFPLWRVNVE
jgi:hypothetical protein